MPNASWPRCPPSSFKRRTPCPSGRLIPASYKRSPRHPRRRCRAFRALVRPAPPPALTVEAVDDALRTLARIIRDHGDHLDRAALMTMAENLYAERARLERGKDVAAYMERLLQAAE